MKYELLNMDEQDSFSVYATSNLTWEPHFHKAIEIIIVISGEIDCTINNKKYTLAENEAVIIMLNQIHSFTTNNHSRIQLIRFSPKLAGTFFKQYENQIPANNKFKIIHPLPYTSKGLPQPENIFELKGLIYTLIGDFCYQCKEWTSVSADKNIIYQLVLYIEENFKNPCSLKTAAKSLNYDYTYVSKEFLKVTGLTFVEYLNNCRINYACYLLENSDLSVTQIAYECGYNTLRTFNRNFLKYANVTPIKYLKSKSNL